MRERQTLAQMRKSLIAWLSTYEEEMLAIMDYQKMESKKQFVIKIDHQGSDSFGAKDAFHATT